MQRKKRGFALLMGGIYALLSLGLLVSVTGAKYTDSRTAYTLFQPANFNAAILLQAPSTAGTETRTTQRVDVSSVQPGMEGATALKIPFYVANGQNPETAAGVHIQYTIRIRTGNNLPLRYSLEIPGADTSTVFTAGNPEPQKAEENKQVWYERSFYPQTAAETVVKLSDGEGGGTVQQPEAVFYLTPEQVGAFAYQPFNLVVEWPMADSQTSYMKEVEVLDILVTAHSVNRNAEEGYIPAAEPTVPEADTYTPGVILLEDPAPNATATYDYTIDLRAFQKTGAQEGVFHFYVDNAVGYQKPQTTGRIDYTLKLKVPMKRSEVQNGQQTVQQFTDMDMSFYMDTEWMLHKTGYIIRNERTGEEREYASEANIASQTLGEDDRIYAIYTYAGAQHVLENVKKQSATNVLEPLASKNLHKLTIKGDDVTNTETLAFLYKLELEIFATFSGDGPTVNTGTPEPEAGT